MTRICVYLHIIFAKTDVLQHMMWAAHMMC